MLIALAARAAAAPMPVPAPTAVDDRVALAVRYADALTGEDRDAGSAARPGAPSGRAAADAAWDAGEDGADDGDDDDCDLDDEGSAAPSPRGGQGRDARDSDERDTADLPRRWPADARCSDDDDLDELVDRSSEEEDGSSRLLADAEPVNRLASDRSARVKRPGSASTAADRDLDAADDHGLRVGWPADLIALGRRLSESRPADVFADADSDVAADDDLGDDESGNPVSVVRDLDGVLADSDGDDAELSSRFAADRDTAGESSDGSGTIAMLDAELDPGDTTAGLDAADAMAPAGAAEQYEQSLRRRETSPLGRIDVGMSWRRRWSAPMHSPAYRADELWLVATWRR